MCRADRFDSQIEGCAEEYKHMNYRKPNHEFKLGGYEHVWRRVAETDC